MTEAIYSEPLSSFALDLENIEKVPKSLTLTLTPRKPEPYN